MKLLLKGGTIIDPTQNYNQVADLLIENGLVAQIGANLSTAGAEVFDAQGLVIAPGFVDMHVHLREPGLEAKEDIASGTKAAAAGGFTTIACMPNTKPVVDQAIIVSGILHRAQLEGAVNVKVIGALSKGQQGKELAEIGDMILSGAVAISDDGSSLDNNRLFKIGLEYTSMFGCPVISHAEDESLVDEGVMHEGAVSAMLGMKGRPSVAEDIAVARDIMLAEYTDSLLHIAHVSSKGAVELIRQAKKRGVKVTAEATPHHLTLTDEAVKAFNTAAKVNPPLRSADHVAALVEGLKDGTLDAIATDHAPHAFEEKDIEFRQAPPGFAGLETALGVILTELYHTGKFTLVEIIEKMSTAPASILNIEAGSLKAGVPADIAIIDTELEWTVDSSAFYTKGKHTPFDKKILKGKAVATIVSGKFVMRKGKVCI
ncbi:MULTISPECIES: dihydroorotase [Pelosinus]|uniref:Dihydroorotase n=1 Tax=Pelosinus fermentans B4 TaxID=1149862 RepID=I8RIM2_9FIRM|nr:MULTISPECIES: dihydroorotase [Pelosinus]EIW17905.1 dihydroorotase, multifunctional complex type [Pelosinus fermentans B4]EIW23867.1 dihydroorotase, multifunctional complex type [Pelosinus fermentans A11]OAM94790.1 dihydroorotase multifunctional complex type [Pelosinus fermentans DSM 17108]SDR17623.1 dihydroorotase [Pelosinus fermentans]